MVSEYINRWLIASSGKYKMESQLDTPAQLLEGQKLKCVGEEVG